VCIFAQVRLRILVGKNIKKYRQAAKISQESLAAKAKLHSNYISLLERGGANISVDSIERVSRALKVNPVIFFEPEANREDSL
jgi:transcriptional regulator with XRE-family HTH domain